MRTISRLIAISIFSMGLLLTARTPNGQAQDQNRLSVENAHEIVPLVQLEAIAPNATLAFAANSSMLYALDQPRGQIMAWDITAAAPSAETVDVPSSLSAWETLTAGIAPDVLDTLHPEFAANQHGVLALADSENLTLQHRDEQVSINSPTGSITNLSFTSHGDLLIGNRADADTIFVWESAPFSSRTHLVAGRAPMAISTNGEWLVATNPYNAIEVHRVRDVINNRAATPFLHLNAHFDRVSALAFSNDSQWLASGSADATISIWDVASGEQRAVLHGHRGPVEQLAFTADNSLVISASTTDHTVRLWDVAEGRLLHTIETVHGHFALSPNEQYLAAIYGDHLVIYGIGEAIAMQDVQLSEAQPTLSPGIRGVAGRSEAYVGCALNPGDAVVGIATAPDGNIWAYVPACEEAVWVTWEARVQWEQDATTLPLVPPRTDPLLRLPDVENYCNGIDKNTVRGGGLRTQAAYPPTYLPTSARATLDNGNIEAVMCFDYPTVVIENCHNLGPGNYSYIYVWHRVDTVISLVDYDSGTVVAQERFEGIDPPACPDYAIRGDGFGELTPEENWLPFVYSTFYGVSPDATFRTTTRTAASGRAEPTSASDIVASIAATTPLTPVARSIDGNWLAVLTPAMDIAWVDADDVSVAVQRDIERLPVSDANVNAFMFEVTP